MSYGLPRPEIDPIGPLVEFDQNNQRVARARLFPCCLGYRDRCFLGHFTGQRHRSQVKDVMQFSEMPHHRAAPKHLLSTGEMANARGDLTGGEGFDHA